MLPLNKALEIFLPIEKQEQFIRRPLNKSEAILFVHQPQNLNQAQEARKTLIYEELYLFEYKMLERALMHRGTLPLQDFVLLQAAFVRQSATPYIHL